MENQIVKVNAAEFGLTEDKAKQVSDAFKPMLDKMVELENEFNEIAGKDVTEELCLKAGELRKKYVKVRTGSAAIHKELKDFYLQGGKFVDGWKNAQIMASSGKEQSLADIEKHFENIEKEKLLKIHNDRSGQLMKFDLEVIPENLHQMKQDVWVKFLAGTKLNYDNIKAAEQQAENDRIEKEQTEKKRLDDAETENKRLKAEAEKTRVAEEKAQAERDKVELERKAKVEKEESERRVAEEKAQAEKEKVEKENQRLKDEAKSKEDFRIAEEKKKSDKIEADKQAEIATENKRVEAERVKGDVDKFKDLATEIENLKTKFSFSEVESFTKMSKVTAMLSEIIKVIGE